ncbi:MAG: hypothetical protein Tsb0013_18770 [Phycisphaerales bacterium]
MRSLLSLIVLLFAPALALADREPPAEAIVWWSFDPTRFEHPDEPHNAAFLPVLRAGVGAGLFGDGTEASILEALLAASEVGRAPHTFAVIDFSAEREADNSGMDIRRLQIVLELRTGEGHDRFLRTIKRIALDAPRAKRDDGEFEAGQFRLDLPGGRKAIALRDSADAPWEQLAWCSEEGVFTVGYGVGALERWFAARPAAEPEWDGHRAVVDATRPSGDGVLEAYVNFDALEERFPSAFQFGRTPRMLDALRLREASSAMLHGRFVDQPIDGLPLLVLDHTAHTEDGMERTGWTLDAWPDGLARVDSEDGATYALVAAPDWRALVDQAIEIHNATIPQNSLEAHMQRVERWKARRGGALAELLASLGEHLVLTDAPQPPAPVPGLATVLVPLAGEHRVAADAMSEVLADFADRVRTKGSADRTDWTYSIDSGGLVRLPVWTVIGNGSGAALIGGWGHACIDVGERWLAPIRPVPE